MPEPRSPHPTNIGGYSILHQQHEDSLHVLYAAHVDETGTRAAVKVLRPDAPDHDARSRLLQERDILQLLDHESILRMIDSGKTLNGRHFLALEPLEGAPLLEFCDGRQMPIRERLELFVKVCGAVQHFHDRGVIHQNLKPANIWVQDRPDGPRPLVHDFLLASLLGRDPREYDLGLRPRIIGTPGYMAPEQTRGEPPLELPCRSDLYSLGIILYELLAGSLPIPAGLTRELLLQAGSPYVHPHRPPPLSALVRESSDAPEIASRRQTSSPDLQSALRGDLDAIALKAIHQDPDARYQSAHAFGQDIERHLRGEAPEARPGTSRTWPSALALVALGASATAAVWALRSIWGSA